MATRRALAAALTAAVLASSAPLPPLGEPGAENSSTHAASAAASRLAQCAATGGKCGGSFLYHGPYVCCSGHVDACVAQSLNYAECRPECPRGLGWICDGGNQKADADFGSHDYSSAAETPRPPPPLQRPCQDPFLQAAAAAAAAHPVCLFTHSDVGRFLAVAPRLTRSWPSEIRQGLLIHIVAISNDM
jgi:hypothetical protein